MANEKETWEQEGFVQVMSGIDTDRIWDKAQPLRGMYLDVRTGIGANKSNMYIIESNGDIVGVWGSKVLDDLMAKIEVGTEVGIICLGQLPQQNDPDKTFWAFEVFSKPVAEVKTVAPTTEAELDKELGIK